MSMCVRVMLGLHPTMPVVGRGSDLASVNAALALKYSVVWMCSLFLQNLIPSACAFCISFRGFLLYCVVLVLFLG